VGGLAARAWGATRDLVDLDFYVPCAALPALSRTLSSRVPEPVRVRAPDWDVTVLHLEIEGCPVDLGAAEDARWREARTGTWHAAAVDWRRAEAREVLGVMVPVMPLDDLLGYKRALGRDVDAVDLYELTGEGGPAETRLVVYGTLAPGEANHDVVRGIGGTWSRAAIHGHLHDTGWGLTYGFPALAWNPDGPPVDAHLLESAELGEHWARLDTFEGPAYRRQVVPVRTERGRVLACAYTVRWPA
jgi:gamma-glutamylcyclotransferase (GGCT)/AIG2-like uncharacterized protein YtfP